MLRSLPPEFDKILFPIDIRTARAYFDSKEILLAEGMTEEQAEKCARNIQQKAWQLEFQQLESSNPTAHKILTEYCLARDKERDREMAKEKEMADQFNRYVQKALAGGWSKQQAISWASRRCAEMDELSMF